MKSISALIGWIAGVTVEQTLRAAILCTLASLGCMVLQSVLPIPLLLVVGMGVSHGLGALGVMLFGLSVLKEVLALPNGDADSGRGAGGRAEGESSSSNQASGRSSGQGSEGR